MSVRERTRSDVLVIGAGIAGASLACELARFAHVTLLDREPHVGYHSTGRSAALFTQTYGSELVRQLTGASRGFLEQPPIGFCDAPLLRPRGLLWLTSPGRECAAADFYARLGESASHAEQLDAAQIRERLPRVRATHCNGGVLERCAADIDVDALLQSYIRAVRRQGSEVRMACEVVAIARRDRGWSVTLLGGDQVWAPVLVNAAGAWSDVIAGLADVSRIGLRTLRRTAAVVDTAITAEIRDWPMIVDLDEAWFCKPDAGALLVSPADQTPVAPADVYADDFDVAVAIDRVSTVLEVPITRLRRSWAGLRNFVVDENPVVGWDGEVPGFFWLAAQGGFGVQTAPALAELAGAMILSRPLPEFVQRVGMDVTALAVDRLR